MEFADVGIPQMTSISQTSIAAVLVCDTQPVTVTGVKGILNLQTEFLCSNAADSLDDARDLMQMAEFDIFIIDMAFGVRTICTFLEGIRTSGAEHPAPIVWGNKFSEADTGHLLKAGVKGILSRTAETRTLLDCLRAVVRGHLWVEEQVLRNMHCPDHPSKVLTNRETEVLELLLQGLINREIAEKLGICQGTVKIHVKNIFAKTGVHGRHSLGLTGIFSNGMNAIKNEVAAA